MKRHPRCSLSINDEMIVCDKYTLGSSASELAIEYSVATITICRILAIYGKGRLSIHDANDIIEHKDIAEIILRNRRGVEIARTIISSDKIPIVRDKKWCLCEQRVITRNKQNGKTEYLHRLIINTPDELVTDHINGNPLDNRTENLRICTQFENQRNRTKINKNSTTGTTGVYISDKKYVPYIWVNGKHLYFKRCITLKEAVKIRLKAEQFYFGKFAPKQKYKHKNKKEYILS